MCCIWISEKTEVGKICPFVGERRGARRVLVGKPERRGPFGRPRHSWKNNIKLDL